MLKPQTPGNRGRRDEAAQPPAGKSLRKEEIHPFGRRKLEFPNMQISNSGYLEKVFKNIKKKVNLAEDAPPLGIQAHTTNILIWGIFMSASMKAVIHNGTRFF